MLFYFRTLLPLRTLALAGLCAATLSCSKKEDTPAPTTGSLAGTIAPATAVTSVTATDSKGDNTSVTPNSDSGDFSIANLQPGTYTVQFSSASGYLPVADRSVSVAAGQTNSLGTIRVGTFVAGTVDGTISPVGSVDFVSLTAPGSTQGVTTQPDVNGYFRFTGVVPGTYNVSFRVTSNYLTPSPRSVTVAANANAAVGTVTVSPAGSTNAPVRGSVRWQADNSTYTTTNLTGNVFLNNGAPSGFSFTATSLTGTAARIMGLSASNLFGSPLLINNDGSGSYLRTDNGIPGPLHETRYRNGAVGTITITALDATARTISGSFGFTAYVPPPSLGEVMVSGGSFTISY